VPWAYHFFSHAASNTRFLSSDSASIFFSSAFSLSSSLSRLSDYTRQVVTDAKEFRPLNGRCKITSDGEAIALATDFDGLGIKGAKTSLELQAGPCTMRFAYSGHCQIE